MKLFTSAVIGALLAAAAALPAAAQTTLYRNHPTTWHKPVSCRASIKQAGEAKWSDGFCDRVETSTGGSSHNIRFRSGQLEMLYVTSYQAPTEVHAVVLTMDDTSTTIAVTGECEMTARNTVICSALANDRSFGMVNGAVFGEDFPELRAILR